MADYHCIISLVHRPVPSILMTVDVEVEVKRLPDDERDGKVVPHHRCSMDVGGVFVNAEVVNNNCTTSDDVPVQEVAVHVQQENCDGRQAPNDGQVEENRLAEPFAVDENFRVVNGRLLVGLDVVAVDGRNVQRVGQQHEVPVEKAHDDLRQDVKFTYRVDGSALGVFGEIIEHQSIDSILE